MDNHRARITANAGRPVPERLFAEDTSVAGPRDCAPTADRDCDVGYEFLRSSHCVATACMLCSTLPEVGPRVVAMRLDDLVHLPLKHGAHAPFLAILTV